jgi:hypothetical protein
MRPNKTYIVAGLFAMAIGALPLLTAMGILPQAQHAPSDPAPSWMGWLIGLIFASAGVSVIVRGFVGGSADTGELPASAPRSLRVVNELIGVFIICALAMLFTWIGFGAGTRHFAVSSGGMSTMTSGSGDSMGRVAFGFGAILFWCLAAYAVVTTLRRWRRYVGHEQ